MITFKTPSDIALVKYWDKKGEQLSANPSISFALSHCYTKTSIAYQRRSATTMATNAPFFSDFSLDGQPRPSFHPKIEAFFAYIAPYLPFLTDYHFSIHSHGSFPHSNSIASSVSTMAVLSVYLMQVARELGYTYSEEEFWQKASFLARLGSGSVYRSVEGSIVVWGQHPSIVDSSDDYGILYPPQVAPVFADFQDTILLIDREQKQVSNTVGHNLMHGHPSAEARFLQANSNIDRFIGAFATGDIDTFIEVVESEALTLHAMMQTSIPYLILIRPNTLEVIQRVWQYRKDTKVSLCFTPGVGANVHLLYPKNVKDGVQTLIKNELAHFCEEGKYINDQLAN